MKLDLRNKLSLTNVEHVLRDFPFTARKGWSKQLREDVISINLSKVGWVEPIAAMRLVLFIEAALLNGLRVAVSLPLPTATRAEQRNFELAATSRDKALHKKASNIASNIRRRVGASVALRDLRFREALTDGHLAAFSSSLTIIEKHDWSLSNQLATPEPGSDQLESSHPQGVPPWGFDVVYGFQWVPDPRSDDGRRIIHHLSQIDVLASVLAHPSQRVSAADGATLAHVFLKELVENAVDHSGREFALIAALRRPRGYNLKQDEIYECETDFAVWCKNYPLIEVMVGDSGCGIPKSLVEEYRVKRPGPPDSLKQTSTNTRVLAWAFDKWSSKSSSDSKRGTRGLYRAERIVRKYDGCITLRSESSYVGVECGSKDPPDYVFEQNLPRTPGTIVHVRLPVIPSERLPERPTIPALHRSIIEVLDFKDLNWRQPDASIDYVCESLRQRSERKASHRRPQCLVLDFACATLERRVLEELLLRLVEIAHPTAVVVANIKAPSADAASETIHSIAERIAPQERSKTASAEILEGTSVRDAILFEYSNGGFTWVGSPSVMTGYLDRLWINQAISSEELKGEIPDAARRNEIIRQFAEAYHVAHRDPAGGLVLNFNETDIRETLEEHVRMQLCNRIASGQPPSVLVGNFVTPSLEVVSRFMKVKNVLEQIGLERATIALARKCIRESALQHAKRIHLVADWKTSLDVVESFRDDLCELLQFPRNSFLISQVISGQIPDFEEESEIVLFTDLILTGDVLTSLMAQIVRGRRTPILVVTAVDARREDERGTPLTVIGRQIPVLAMAEIDVRGKATAKANTLGFINAVTHERETIRSDPAVYALDETILRQMIDEENALYFEHIVRPNGRHFCFYLDPFKLLGALDTDDPSDLSQNGRLIIQTFAAAIDDWLLKDKLDIIYFPNLPRSERPSAAKSLIGSELSKRYGAKLVPISARSDFENPHSRPSLDQRIFQFVSPRATLDSYQPWLFESFSVNEIDRIPPSRAVVIDWGSITGTAIRTAIRYAAGHGANRVLVVALLSQLSLDEERFLSSLTQIEVDHANGARTRICDIRVIYLSRYPIQVYEPRLCPYCRQLERLDEEERFHPTKLLAEFIKQAKHRLRPRLIEGDEGVRAEYRNRRILTLQGDAPEDCGSYKQPTLIAEIRSQLDAARTWTHSRWDFYRFLSSLEQPVGAKQIELRLKRSCLINLLAVEWLWLKQEPLSMIKFKRQVSTIAINVVKDTTCSQDEKLDALVVLRTASKDAFSTALPDLAHRILHDKKIKSSEKLSLISQLLYGAFTYLQRDYLMPENLRPLVDALSETASKVHSLMGKPQQSTALRVSRTVNSLQQYGRFLLNTIEQITAPEAWRRLKELLGPEYHIHHPVCVAFDSLRFGALESDIERSVVPPKINWGTKRKSWEQKCVPFIIETLLPLLSPLREVFEGLDARIMVGENRAETLAITERRIFRDLASLSYSLMIFTKSKTAVQQPGQWKDFVQARDYLWTLLVDPGLILRGNVREGGSALVRLLQDCPADILSVLKDIVNGQSFGDLTISVINNLPEESKLVFCHVDVLRESVLEMLRNIERHVRPQNNESDSSNYVTTIVVQIDLTQDNQLVKMRIRNTGDLVKSEIHGRGLEMCSERLNPYGALVETEPNLPSPWVFGVSIKLLKG